MKSLAKGTSSDCIFKLLKVTISTQQQIYSEALKNTEIIEDITEKVESPLPLFGEDESMDGIQYNNPIDEEGPDPNHKYFPSYIEDQIKSDAKPVSTSAPNNSRSAKFDYLLNQ